MADWSLPTNSSLYTDYTAQNDARMDDLAVGLDPAVTTASNIPTNTVRWNSASARWQKWSGSAWADLSTAYQINITGNAGTATTLQTARTINGVSFNGSANITVTSSTTQALTFNNGGAGAASGTTFNGGTAQTISYNSVGAPSTTGTNASGTWGISITGSAPTLTTARTINGVSFNGSANIVVEPYIEDDETTAATRYLVFVDSTTAGYQRLNEDSALTYNPGTNTLTVGTVSGALSGNASTATTLQTARTINGVSFNGSANITVTANTTNALTFSSAGSGGASGTTFNGSAAQTISYNSVGAPSITGANASGTWNINVSGNAATATTAAACTGNSATVTNGVYTTGDQTIGGIKNFSSVIGVGGQAGSSAQWTTVGWTRAISMAQGQVVWWPKGATSVSKGIGSTGDNNIYFAASTADSGATVTYPFQFDMSVGNFSATGSVTSNSDIKLKSNLVKIDGALAKVHALTGYTYTMKATGQRQTGLVAQDVLEVLPEAVIDNDGTLALAYGNLVGLLVEAIKELTAEVNMLKGK